MSRRVSGIVFLCLVGTTAWAGDITLGSSSSSVSALKAHAGILSGEMLFNVTSNTAPSDASDELSAWQVRLDIVPMDGATGSLSFHSADVPDDDYIFDGLGTIGDPVVQNGGSRLFHFETTFPFASVGVTTTGLNLFTTDYLASSDALGSVGIFAIPGAANTIWADGTLAQRRARKWRERDDWPGDRL